MPLRKRIDELEAFYARFNRRTLARHDPIVFLYGAHDPADREVTALVAASLAFGRVAQVLASVAKALAVLGPRPARSLRDATDSQLAEAMRGFRHRFVGGREMAALLAAARDVRREYGSLRECFAAGTDSIRRHASPSLGEARSFKGVGRDSAHNAEAWRRRARHAGENYLPAITHLAETLRAACGGACGFLVASPARGSACKRLNMMLRWLVRRDEVDPGGWEGVSPAGLLVPLDTHMHRMCRTLGATRRRAADLRAVVEATAAFRAVRPDDPVRYDFALTRVGILGLEEKGHRS